MSDIEKVDRPLPSADGKVSFTPVGLDVEDELTWEEWESLGGQLQFIRSSWQWWAGDWLRYGEHTWGEKYTQAVDATGKTEKALQNAQWVADRFESSNRLEDLSWSHHLVVAGSEHRHRLLDLAARNGWSKAELQRVRREEKRISESDEDPEPVIEKLEEGVASDPNEARDLLRQYHTPLLPDGKYRVIYADPPWQYSQKIDKYGPAERHYPTMPKGDICDLAVDDLAADDAVLFLWATSPKLETALEVIDSWGFTYKASFVWDKVRHNYGHYNSVRHELLLIGTRGSCTPDSNELLNSVQRIERTDEHSRKPARFRQIIDEMYLPNEADRADRVELFARGELPDHWNAWGNEADVDV